MSLTVLSTADAPRAESRGYWGELVSRSFGRLQSDTYGDRDFSGLITYVSLGSAQVGTLAASRHRVVRRAGTRGASDPGQLKLVVQRRGRCLFEQDGRRAWLRPGDWSLYDTTRSYIVSAPDTIDIQVLMLPRHGVLRGRPELGELLVRRLRGSSGLARIAFERIASCLEEARAGVAQPPDAGERLTELVHLALLEQAGERIEPSERAMLRERIKAFIEERLADPDLDVPTIAMALGYSLRTVHKAFEVENCSVAQFIWERRLAAVRHELERAPLTQSISDIAFAWGFSSAAHFSRAFRALHGVSASEWRRGSRPTLQG